MLHIFYGSDHMKARNALNVVVRKEKNATVVRITDVHTPEDREAALAGGGMFGDAHVVILDGVLALMNGIVPERSFPIFVLEESIDAATRKRLEKQGAKIEQFDLPKKPAARDNSIFVLANALRAGKKKDLWVGYQRQLLRAEAPEAIHGVFFWAAKDMFLKTGKGKKYIARLAELPHAARRSGVELEYALEQFILSEI